MRSHLSAFGVGAAMALLAVGAFVFVAPRFMSEDADGDGEGVHIINIGGDDSGSFHLRKEGVSISGKWKGDFAYAADGRSLAKLERSLEIRSKEAGGDTVVLFEKEGGAIVARVSRAGEALQGAEADRLAGDLLLKFARVSSVNTESRVAAMIAESGPAAVIAEIAAMSGDDAVGAYVEALAAKSPLAPADIKLLADRVASVSGDYAKRTALAALFRASNDDASTAAILEAAKLIGGDHELRLLIEEMIEKDASERTIAAAFSLLERIDGDHEIRLAVEAMLETDATSDKDAAIALEKAVSLIDGDYERRLVIEAASERLDDAGVAAAAIAAISKIDGAHERRLAVEEVASQLEKSASGWLALIAAAVEIDGDHERRLAIEEIAAEAPKSDDVKKALAAAAASISSSEERRLAEEALEE